MSSGPYVSSHLVIAAPYLKVEANVVERTFPGGDVARDIVVIERTEVDPVTRKRHRSKHAFGVNGDVVELHCRAHNDLFLAIHGADGELEIERWLLFDSDGAWTATLPIATTTGPVQTPPIDVFVQGGGDWVAPADREPAPLPRRLLLATRPWTNDFRGLGVDPDGRFYFLLFRTHIEQVEAQGGGQVLATFGTANSTELDAITGLVPMETAQHGRVHYGTIEWGVDHPYDFALIDQDNDGVFEQEVPVDRGARSILSEYHRDATRFFFRP